MLKIKILALLISSFVLFDASCFAQNDSNLTVDQINIYSNQSKQLISYLEGTLNFLGNPNELPSDKDIIFNSSYLKIFKNAKVQVEDDLDENREIPLNKDVQAYLKDIDFFFKNVEFHFEIKEIEQLVNDSGIIIFKLTLNRHLRGITVNNDTVDNNQPRFVEINLDPYQRDLKIASIYTTKVREKEELKYWWNNMSANWKNYFGRSVIIYDTLPFKNIVWFTDSSILTQKWVDSITVDTNYANQPDSFNFSADSIMGIYDTTSVKIQDTILVNTSIIYSLLKTFRGIEKLDVSNNQIFKDLSPVSGLTELKEINISNTLINDLSPIRNLNKLEIFNCSNSPVNSLESLRYINALKELNCSNTNIDNIDITTNLLNISNLELSNTKVSQIVALADLKNLVHLNISGTNISDLRPLNNLNLLSDLNLSNTKLQNISSLDSLTNIQHLNIDSTNISDLKPLSNYHKLSILQANSTSIKDISSLNNHVVLKVIYCDNSNVSMEIANTFMDINPQCLVIYNSQELINWWDNLSLEWQSIFNKNYGISKPVTKEKLHQLINQTRLSIAYNQNISSLEPVRMLHRLEEIDLQHTLINDLAPLSGLANLESINLNQSKITSLKSLSSLNNLETISFIDTKINNLNPLLASNNIKRIYCDRSEITTKDVLSFNSLHPTCLIIYQSENLRLWWNNLDVEWQQMLSNIFNLPESPSNEELQQLADLKELSITNNPLITDLNPLHIFIKLEHLTVNSTSITDISPITSLTSITKLNISGNPISDLESINKLINIVDLNLENTSVEELEPIAELEKISSLNIAGTRVKTLKYLQLLTNLEDLYINNTRVKNIKQLYGLSKLRLLQCYNTSIKASKIKEFSVLNAKLDIIYY